MTGVGVEWERARWDVHTRWVAKPKKKKKKVEKNKKKKKLATTHKCAKEMCPGGRLRIIAWGC